MLTLNRDKGECNDRPPTGELRVNGLSGLRDNSGGVLSGFASRGHYMRNHPLRVPLPTRHTSTLPRTEGIVECPATRPGRAPHRLVDRRGACYPAYFDAAEVEAVDLVELTGRWR